MKLSAEQLAQAMSYWTRRYGQEQSPEAAAELMRALHDYIQCLRELQKPQDPDERKKEE